jgi:hypothetical protein
MTYLFKNRFFCTDIFKHLANALKEAGLNVVVVTDENHDDARPLVDALAGKEITLITSDHLDDNMDFYGTRGYSVRECIQLLKPKRLIFGIHDLGIKTVDDDVSGFEIFLPHESWKNLFNNKTDKQIHITGHGKFIDTQRDEKYDSIFFVSSVYVYANRDEESFLNAFPIIFKNKIPFKFPKYKLSQKLIDIVKSRNIEVIDPNIESFDLLKKTRLAISNANSSIAIEAAMVGCGSINLGWDYEPKAIYEKFNILSVNEPEVNGFRQDHLSLPCRNNIHEEYLFNITKAMKIITDG